MVGEWLNVKFLEWERTQGRRCTIVEFAEFLGVSQPSLSAWMHGDYNPRGENIEKIALKLGPEIYDVLGLRRPIPPEVEEWIWDLAYGIAALPEDRQVVFREAMEEAREFAAAHNIDERSFVLLRFMDNIKGLLSRDVKPADSDSSLPESN